MEYYGRRAYRSAGPGAARLRGHLDSPGAGAADRRTVDTYNRIAVPPDRPEYTLRRVWLTDEDIQGYYYGFANRGLWPLCHHTYVKPEFNEADWLAYQKVNRIFAEAVLQEAGGRRAFVFVQDYHFALLARFLKEQNTRLTVGQFWHIPWPDYETLRQCPWHEEIMAGLLGNDLLGFHTQSQCQSFITSAENGRGVSINAEKGIIIKSQHTTCVEPFPISVDFDAISKEAGKAGVVREMEKLQLEYRLEGKYVGLGMDRLDYTKGIPERLQAMDKFLADNPSYRGKVVYIMAGMPSRTGIDAYEDLGRKVDHLIENINAKYGDSAWQPLIPLMRQLAPVTLHALRRLAHFCVVSSLDDGMNLVSKEYVAARTDGDGVLILSRFTGAAEELTDALLINPYDIGEFAARIKEAIEMPEAERRRRMGKMRKVIAENNIYRWGASIISRLMQMAEG